MSADDEQRKILNSSAVMAAGTLFSRLSGFLRSALLVVVLGNLLHADIYNLANTVPNMLYILLAGGIFNAVLVPQLVRTMKADADGGEAYANRVVTLAALFLGTVTILLVLAAPWVMSVFLDSSWDSAALVEQRESLIMIARYCLPQVFFYGMFVLVGQILNARGTFGPMMWAPIANNLISILVLGLYLVTFGPAAQLCSDTYAGPASPVDSVLSGYTPGREALLGLGSTLGIAVQFLILLPYLRKAGFRFSPRFDFRNTGLGHTLRLGAWTVAFVIVNQIAYTVVVRLASSGTAAAAAECAAPQSQGTGYTIYSNSFLLAMVPHSIITVSLATAILPALSARAAEGDLAGLGHTLARTLRNALAVMVPFALCLAVIAPFLAKVVWGLGAGSDSYGLYVPTLTLFAVAIVCFTVHYLMLRGFYALELNRTVFFVQCAIAATNIVVAVALVRATSAQHTAPALVGAYLSAYALGAAISYALLRRLVGGLQTRVTIRFLVRTLLASVIAAATAYLVLQLVTALLPERPNWFVAATVVGVVALIDLGVFVALAKAMRLTEVTSVVETVTGRLGPRIALGARRPRRKG